MPSSVLSLRQKDEAGQMNSSSSRPRAGAERRGALIRFLGAGLANTGLTYALYLLLLAPLGYALAYSIAFVCGIGISFALNRGIVFKSRSRSWRQALFPLMYLVQFGLGLALVAFWVEMLALPAVFATPFAILFTVPLTFLASRWIFRH